jgi:DEAD/DEAH box helicase domain-containing protein
VIEDVETGRLLGEVGKFDAPTMLHPEAIHLHRGETWRVLALDLERSVATVRRVDVDYYTQALGGDDVHHVDRVLREKPFGSGTAGWGEVTAYAGVHSYERIRFYTLDAVSKHPVTLPVQSVETMAFWVEPPEELMTDVKRAGLSPVAGLRGLGYATRMLLPLFVTLDTLDLSHTVGAANAPWRTVFVWEHYPRGLGFTERGYDVLHRLLPTVREHVRDCPCGDGCPRCVGKPLRPYTVVNVERGEGSIPSKSAALMVLDGLLGDGTGLEHPDRGAMTDSDEGLALRLERSLRRRLERMRQPEVLHPVAPRPPTGFPAPEQEGALDRPDAAVRGERRRDFVRKLRRRVRARRKGDDR